MLNLAQIAVGGNQFVGHVAAAFADLDQPFDRGTGRAFAQFLGAAAPDQLLGLGEELHLADAAASELDVVAGDRDMAVALDRIDLPL